jgi:hypothetical protein
MAYVQAGCFYFASQPAVLQQKSFPLFAGFLFIYASNLLKS